MIFNTVGGYDNIEANSLRVILRLLFICFMIISSVERRVLLAIAKAPKSFYTVYVDLIPPKHKNDLSSR